MTDTVLIGGTFCDATAIQCDEFASEIAGISLYVRSGNSYRTATINDPNDSGIATFTSGCIFCPGTTPTPTPTLTATPTLTTTPGFTIDWGFQQGAQSGDFSISVNGTTVISRTSTDSGQILVASGDTITTNVGAGATNPLIAQADLLIYNAGTLIYNNSQTGQPTAGNTYTYTVAGNGTIDASASEF
jgi:hypothetical protein